MPYFQTYNYPFQYDDIPTIFESGGMESVSDVRLSERPVRKISLMIDKALFKNNVIPYRIENMLFLYISILLTGIFIYILTGNIVFSLLSMLLFGFHPIHVSSVTIVTHRKELFQHIFAMLFLIAHVRQRKIQSTVYLLLALLSKETAVMLPFIALVYDYIFKIKLNRKTYMLYGSVLAAGVLAGIVFASKSGFYVPGISSMDDFFTNNRLFRHARYYHILLMQPYIFMRYLFNLILPINLNIDYFIPLTEPFRPLVFTSYAFTAAYAFVMYRMRRNRYMFFAMAFFIISYLPVSNIIPVVNLVSDRYMFTPSIVLLIGLYAVPKDNIKTYIMIPAGIACLILTMMYIPVFKAEIRLWDYVVRQNPKSVVGNNNLGLYYMRQGNGTAAYQHLKKAWELDTLYANAAINLGTFYAETGRKDSALIMFKKAVEIEDFNIKAYYNLALTYFKMDDIEHALDAYNKIIDIMPSTVIVHNNMGSIFYKEGLTLERELSVFTSMYMFPLAGVSGVEAVLGYVNADSCFERALSYDRGYDKAVNNKERTQKKLTGGN